MKILNENRISSLLEYIKKYKKENGKSPSYREILSSLKYKSLSMVAKDINILKSRNLIKVEDNIGIITPSNLKDEGSINVPFVGTCACGEPILAIENITSTIKLPIEIFGKDRHIILKAQGRSMIKCGIFPNDLLIVNIDKTAHIGDIIVARVNNEEATTKILARNGEQYYLKPSSDEVDEKGNKIYKDIYPMGEWDIIGVVSHVLHIPKEDING